MPTSALRPCPHPGCGVLVAKGRCPAHERQRYQEIDARRESSSKRGYGSKWQNYRRHWLRLRPLCGDRDEGNSVEHSQCVRQARITAASDVDHIVPHRGDKRLFWDSSNHQSLCSACHSAKTAREDGGFGNTPRGG
jgi:5-methylcytosine-specific restriction protein A